MRYRKLSPTGDYVFGQSANDFYNNVPAAPGQAVKTSLLLFQGEWFLDSSVGTPYFVGILGKHSQALADATVQNQILNTEGVTNITQYTSNIDPATRAYSVEAAINTVYGPTQVQIQNYVNF